MRKVVTGLGLVESVRWEGDAVWFADWTRGAIHRWDEHGGDRIVAEVPSLPLCFDLYAADVAVLDSRGGRLLRGSGGRLEPWVDVSGLSRGAGNEVLSVGDGSFYLNFGNFDPTQGFPIEPVGLVAHVGRDGTARVVAEGLAFPNGMALTPKGETLLVAESHAARIAAFTVTADGGLTDRRTWAEVAGSAPDGISLGPDATCWFADVPNRRVVGVAEGGQVRAEVPLDRGGFSCAVSADGSRLAVAAAHWPGGERMGDPTHCWDGTLLVGPTPTAT